MALCEREENQFLFDIDVIQLFHYFNSCYLIWTHLCFSQNVLTSNDSRFLSPSYMLKINLIYTHDDFLSTHWTFLGERWKSKIFWCVCEWNKKFHVFKFPSKKMFKLNLLNVFCMLLCDEKYNFVLRLINNKIQTNIFVVFKRFFFELQMTNLTLIN